MRILAAITALAAVAVLGASIYNRAFGAYGYTPHTDDAIALALIGLLVFVAARKE